MKETARPLFTGYNPVFLLRLSLRCRSTSYTAIATCTGKKHPEWRARRVCSVALEVIERPENGNGKSGGGMGWDHRECATEPPPLLQRKQATRVRTPALPALQVYLFRVESHRLPRTALERLYDRMTSSRMGR